MRELNIHDLKIISGGFGPAGAAGGAAVAAVSYSGYAISSGQGSAAGLAGATAAGGAAGFFGGPATFPAIAAGAEIGFHAGLIGGGIERIFNGQNSPSDPAGLNYCGKGY